ncbi:aminodeoxychorismate/anthranilate synthase component II [Rhodocytophaga rosea]|uniref:Aminodeoxychorismate/anthranilate synthase component II n=1 Tax=Rhodocytophaga rosea TaxID=2704465 RepID=A0A6C0GPJ8_9BACT|nr:aminodeoxychorismate/anthranilate synthase component II [Rhodocytophaga rosea]QHT69533.1 aminodeoxychorismate/anthranilate synthase component II [Rhodocytophaga rosea]
MILLLDNLDSFTYNLADYIRQGGEECLVLRNTVPISQIKKQAYKAIVLSPGPQTPERAGNMMEVIHYYIQQIPVLGICLGHQAIGIYFGASLVKAVQPMHGKISSVSLEQDELFEQIPSPTNVVRYHSLILEDLPASLETIAHTAEHEIMAIRHKTLPVRGIQFHPEAALTVDGIKMIENWIKFNKLADQSF